MRTIIAFAGAICICINIAKAQKDIDPKTMVGFGCYASGISSAPVNRFNKLVDHKKYKSISKALRSSNSAERYLAVITLEWLDSLGAYQLLPEEKKLIALARTSDDPVSLCSGCTYFVKIPLKDLFSSQMRGFSQRWLVNNVKKE